MIEHKANNTVSFEGLKNLGMGISGITLAFTIPLLAAYNFDLSDNTYFDRTIFGVITGSSFGIGAGSGIYGIFQSLELSRKYYQGKFSSLKSISNEYLNNSIERNYWLKKSSEKINKKMKKINKAFEDGNYKIFVIHTLKNTNDIIKSLKNSYDYNKNLDIFLQFEKTIETKIEHIENNINKKKKRV